MARNEQMIGTREACRFLGISESTMRRLLSRAPVNRLPFSRVGGLYRFYRSELSVWAKSFGSGGGETTEADKEVIRE